MHPVLMDEVAKHKERIETVLPKEEKRTIEDTDEIIGYLEMLKTGLADEDYDTADFISEKLQGYQYPEEIQILVDELAQHILNLETEEAIEVTERVKDTLGNK